VRKAKQQPQDLKLEHDSVMGSLRYYLLVQLVSTPISLISILYIIRLMDYSTTSLSAQHAYLIESLSVSRSVLSFLPGRKLDCSLRSIITQSIIDANKELGDLSSC